MLHNSFWLLIFQERGTLEKKLKEANEYRDKYFKKEEESDEFQDLTKQELAKVKHMVSSSPSTPPDKLQGLQKTLYGCGEIWIHSLKIWKVWVLRFTYITSDDLKSQQGGH